MTFMHGEFINRTFGGIDERYDLAGPGLTSYAETLGLVPPGTVAASAAEGGTAGQLAAPTSTISVSFGVDRFGSAAQRIAGGELEDGDKLLFGLADLYLEYGAWQQRAALAGEGKTNQDDGEFVSSNPLAMVFDGKVAIDIAAASGTGEELLAALRTIGLVNGSAFGRMAGGFIPIESLDALAALDGVMFARPAYALANTGSVDNQADPGMRSDLLRTGTGATGAGITIGVMSNSFDNGPGSYAADILSGDLPAGVNILLDLAGPSTDEGRAMAQLIHDVAPGAGLAYHTAFGSQAGFANGILALANVANADIIVDDVVELFEPMLRDGIIAQAVDQVTAQGVLYFSSASNHGSQSYESVFRDSGVIESVGGSVRLHDFDPGPGVDTRQLVTQDPGLLLWVLQWTDNFFSLDGIPAASNLVLIFRNTSGSIIDIIDGANPDPIEFGPTFNNGALPQQYTVSIGVRGNNVAPDFFKYVTLNTGFTVNEFATNSSTSWGHNNAEGAFAVAAAPFYGTPAFGISPPEAEYFTSRGGTPILYDTAGNRLPGFTFRDNVDFTAPDGSNNTFFGVDTPFDADAFPNFFGTSAAAPNAAAVAALLLELHPAATRADIEAALESSAIDISNIFGTGAFIGFGYDRITGHGLIDAVAASNALAQILVNNAPFVSATSAGNTYTETPGLNSPAGTPVQVFAGVNVSDSDSAVITSAKVEITSGFQPGDLLTVTLLGGFQSSYNPAEGVLTITGPGTPAQYGGMLSTVAFAHAGDNPTNFGVATNRTIAVSATDGLEWSALNSGNIGVAAINDEPVVANAGADSLNEDQALVSINGVTITDPDADPNLDDMSVTLQVFNGIIDLNTSIAGGITAGDVTADATSFVTVNATQAQINATFGAGGLRYTPNANFNGTEILQTAVGDFGNTGGGGPIVNFVPFQIAVNSVNDMPAGVSNAIFGLEETDYVFTVANFPLTDINDSPANTLLSVIISTLPGVGTLGLNGVAVVAGQEITAAAIAGGQLTYTPSGSADSSFTFQVRDNGGTLNGGVNLDSTPNTMTLDINANDDPFVDLFSGGGTNFATVYVEGDPPVAITSGATVTDADAPLGDLIVSLVITVGNDQAGDQLTLAGPLPAGITSTVAIVGGDLTMTLSGPATPADYTIALNLVRFSTVNNDPSVGPRLISVVADDGDDTSTTRFTVLAVVPTDDTAIAQNDQFVINEADTLTGNLFDSNDGLPDIDPDDNLEVELVNGSAANVGTQITLASGALLTVGSNGNFFYDPNDSFLSTTSPDTGASNTNAVDSFFYTLEGGTSALVTINVNGVRSIEDVLIGNAGNDVITDSVGFNDSFFLQQGGNDQANDGGGNDGFYFGEAYTNADSVDGGAGNDSVALQGFYNSLTLGTLLSVNNLVLLSGSDTSFGDSGNSIYDFNVTTIDSNVAAGQSMNVIATGLGPLEDLTFSASAETNGFYLIFAGRGTDNLAGGAGGDGFLFGQQGNWSAGDRVDGNGGIDSLAFRGNYSGANAIVFQNNSFVDVEVVVMLSGLTNQFGGIIVPAGFDYDLTLADGNTAAGQRLDVIGTQLGAIESARIDARAELDGSVRILTGAGDDVLFGSAGADFINGGAGNDRIQGGLGVDTIDGGAGNDTIVYAIVQESSTFGGDTIQGFALGDKVDLSAIDANAAAAGDAAFTFIGSAAFTGVAGQLRVTQVGANSFVQGDVNGDGVADIFFTIQNYAAASGDFVL